MEYVTYVNFTVELSKALEVEDFLHRASKCSIVALDISLEPNSIGISFFVPSDNVYKVVKLAKKVFGIRNLKIATINIKNPKTEMAKQKTIERQKQETTERVKQAKQATENERKKQENILENALEDALARVNPQQPPREVAKAFLKDIKLEEDSNKLVQDAFTLAIRIEKLTYMALSSELLVYHEKMTEDSILSTLKSHFNAWLEERHPELPKMEVISLINVFVSAYKK